MKRLNPYLAELVDVLLICAAVSALSVLITAAAVSIYFIVTL